MEPVVSAAGTAPVLGAAVGWRAMSAGMMMPGIAAAIVVPSMTGNIADWRPAGGGGCGGCGGCGIGTAEIGSLALAGAGATATEAGGASGMAAAWLGALGEITSACSEVPSSVLAICTVPRTSTMAVVPPISARSLPTRLASLPAAVAISLGAAASFFAGASRPAA